MTISLLAIILGALIWAGLTEALESYLAFLALRHKGRARPLRLDVRPLSFLLFWVEAGAFAGLVMFYRGQPLPATDIVQSLATIIGGWFAVKSLSQRLDPSDEDHQGLSQTEMRNRYLLGTLFNIGGGLLLGVVLPR